jgi:hypothetical protein
VNELPSVVGSTDIAWVLGVTRQAVDHRMRHDPTAPPPAAILNRTDVSGGIRCWWREDIDRWLGLDPRRWTV